VSDYRDDGDAAVGEYRSALLSAARDRVVAEAEQEVCLAWAAELAHVGHLTKLGVASAQAACDAAREMVSARQAAGDQWALSEALYRLEIAEEQAQQSASAADALLEIIGEELDLMSRAACERALVARANRDRLVAAWQAAYGAEGVSPGPEAPASGPGRAPRGRKRFRRRIGRAGGGAAG
jgi:hypothetical protein